MQIFAPIQFQHTHILYILMLYSVVGGCRLLEFYILGTSKVISGRIVTCYSALEW